MVQNKLKCLTDKLTSTKGFTLLELCVVMIGISTLTIICIPLHELNQTEEYVFESSYLKMQSQAMDLKQRENLFVNGRRITFNEKGNVQSAMTITFDRSKRRYVVELGCGRLVCK